MRPCGIIVLVGELYMAESKRQVYGFLHNFFSKHPNFSEKLGMLACIFSFSVHNLTRHLLYFITDVICYDDACHLKKFSINPKRSELTPQSKQLAEMKMAVDKMHMRGHTDSWCKDNCDPKKFTVLEKVTLE